MSTIHSPIFVYFTLKEQEKEVRAQYDWLVNVQTKNLPTNGSISAPCKVGPPILTKEPLKRTTFAFSSSCRYLLYDANER